MAPSIPLSFPYYRLEDMGDLLGQHVGGHPLLGRRQRRRRSLQRGISRIVQSLWTRCGGGRAAKLPTPTPSVELWAVFSLSGDGVSGTAGGGDEAGFLEQRRRRWLPQLRLGNEKRWSCVRDGGGVLALPVPSPPGPDAARRQQPRSPRPLPTRPRRGVTTTASSLSPFPPCQARTWRDGGGVLAPSVPSPRLRRRLLLGLERALPERLLAALVGSGCAERRGEAERVVEREREEAGGGGEEDEAASGEGVGEEAGRNELGVDLEEVARLSCLGWCGGFRHTPCRRGLSSECGGAAAWDQPTVNLRCPPCHELHPREEKKRVRGEREEEKGSEMTWAPDMWGPRGSHADSAAT
uniref:Uncharacterized protein n=1 Tax=Oryza sativa subsp. japonica TaxID=39947 RepID=Q84SM1_ORYSJ|nr:hypothetical protein [Oryza sativa Japonica Group]